MLHFISSILANYFFRFFLLISISFNSTSALAKSDCSAILAEGKSLLGKYRLNPNDHPIIPNNSFAGSKVTEGDSAAIKINLRDFQAAGNGVDDDTPAFELALKKVERNKPTVLLIPKGKFKLSGRIFLNSSNLVLRGSGERESVLFFHRSLSEIEPRPNESNGSTAYSWNGGLIHMGPPEDSLGQNTSNSGWGAGEMLTDVISPAKVGQVEITVKDSSNLHKGDYVFLNYGNPPDFSILNFISGLPIGKTFDWTQKENLWTTRSLPWPVEIKEVVGNKIILAQPLRIEVDPQWGAKVQKMGPFISGAGVENLKIVMNSGSEGPHLGRKGFNGILLHRAINSWVKNISIENSDNGVLLNATKNISVLGVKIEGNRRPHHGFFTKNTHDALISNFEINAPVYHGINSDLFGSGNVWSNGIMRHGTFDMHRGMQFDLIRTNIFVNNDGLAGGEVNAGPMQGRRVVSWNIRYKGKEDWVNQPELYPQGLLFAVTKKPFRCEKQKGFIKDLYLEQKKLAD